LLLFSFFILTPAWAQETGAQQFAPIVVRPIEFADPFGGYPKSIGEFTNVPPDVTLVPRGEGARHGQLWIRTVALPGRYGLYIAGKVDGGQPHFPFTRDLIPSKDHIEIWLAGSRDVEMPPIGWGNQFEQITLPKGAESCEDWAKNTEGRGVDNVKRCQEWAESQVRYRQYFKRLFVRQWILAPREQMEVYATPAFEHIANRYSDHFDKVDEIMKPRGNLLLSVFDEPWGYSFQVLIPFDAFPPLPKLDTGELHLLLDVFSAAPAGKKMGAYSTSSPARIWGKTSTFNTLRLDPPFSFSMTACELPLGETAEERDDHRTWFFPIIERNGSLSYSVYKSLPNVTDSFVVENISGCGNWDPGGLSPWVRTTHHFSMGTRREIGVWVCGPNLTIAKGGKSESFPYVISDEGLDYKQMPDGDLLLKFGPHVTWGTGCYQGGGAPTTDLKIFDLSKDMKLRPALSLGTTVDGFHLISQDFTISPDWSQVTDYEDIKGGAESDSWSSTTWCLKAKSQKDQAGGYVYEKCGEKENVQPPNPPVLKELRQGIN
jgi:hypothetical protein